jgi:hypothetical protein
VRLIDHREHVVIGIDERSAPPVRVADRSRGRYLGPQVDPGQVASEPADDHHPVGWHDTPDWHLALERPRERRLDRHEFGALLAEIGHEPWQEPVRVSELVTERAAELEVLVEVLRECAHRVAPGHTRATWRRRLRSTFA